MSGYGFKSIIVVPSAKDFIDVTLSKTQRKTPTVVHPGYKITRIRSFYMRKVKFTQANFHEKLSQILSDFPQLDTLHPFYCDLINVLYDKDHYKLALGQLNTAMHLIDRVSQEYVRMLKYADSLYRAKALKRAALGRMVTIIKKQAPCLAYLEQVRQHLARLPSIDPNTRTIMVCGYPNVGKSSFVNVVSRANVEVQPYAFTTKNLFVGHFDYNSLRWQVIDTPGVLDHELDQRNTIEMLSITALAHLRSAVLFLIDISEQCGYTIEEQISLFNSIRPLFANKPLIIVANKTDVRRMEELEPERVDLINKTVADANATLLMMSNVSKEGVMAVRNHACDVLTRQRVEAKLGSAKVKDSLNRLHLAMPANYNPAARPPMIPESVRAAREAAAKGVPAPPRVTEKQLEEMNGGAGVYQPDFRKHYILDDPEWKADVIPEIVNGKNILDFVDPDVEEMLLRLEMEEEQRLAELEPLPEEEEMDSDEQDMYDVVHEKRVIRIKENRVKRNKNHPVVPRRYTRRAGALDEFEDQLQSVGVETAQARGTVEAATKTRKRQRSPSEGERAHRGLTPSRRSQSLRDEVQEAEVEKLHRKKIRKTFDKTARVSEADRFIGAKKPKHLFSGKRGFQTDRR